MNPNYKAVIFDMDGVIFDSERACMETWVVLAKEYGLENIEESFLACTGTTNARTKEIMIERYGADFPYDEYAAKASKMFHEKNDFGKLPMKEGVVLLLDYLKENNIKIALASSTRKQTVEKELTWAKIIRYFDVIIGGDMLRASKPAPDIYLKACEELNLLPKECFAIEDSFNGIRSAYNGGLRPIMVPDLLSPDEEMESLAEIILPSLTGVVDYLKGQTSC